MNDGPGQPEAITYSKHSSYSESLAQALFGLTGDDEIARQKRKGSNTPSGICTAASVLGLRKGSISTACKAVTVQYINTSEWSQSLCNCMAGNCKGIDFDCDKDVRQ